MAEKHIHTPSDAPFFVNGDGHRPFSRGARLESGYLPPEPPDNLIVTPSINRWRINGDGKAPLPTMIGSVQSAVSREKMGDNTWMVVSDASNDPDNLELRHQALPDMDQGDAPARLFFLLPENQAAVAQKVQERTSLPSDVINATLRGIGYGDHRETLDILARALTVAGNRPLKVLTVDDDIEIPSHRIEWNPDKLPNGLKPRPNSQVLQSFDNDEPPSNLFTKTPNNRLRPLFDHLGKPIREIRKQIPTLRATAGVKDTRSASLHGALRGEASQLELTHADEDDAPGAEDALVAATTLGKVKRPDYPTRTIAKAFLKAEFPSQEVPVESYRSGPTELFAARGSNTIFPDSAVFARYLDEKTAFWRWWFVSNLQISLANPLQTVTGHYRADNDHLPILFDIILEKSAEQFMYLSVDTEALHSRARLGGNRQDMHEQAASSLIGNIAAVEATKRLELDRQTGLWKINREGLIDGKTGQVNDRYQAPLEHARFVYNEMVELASICEEKIDELSKRNHTGETPEVIERYRTIHTSIGQKLGGFNFDEFYRHVSREVRDQLIFYANVVDAVPTVVNEVQNMIRHGEYPVAEYTREPEKITNYPSSNGSSNGHVIFGEKKIEIS